MSRRITACAFGRRKFVSLAAAGAGGILAAPTILRAASAATVVKFGQIEPLTGPSAAYGIRSRDGARMAVDAVNRAGGFHDAKGDVYTIDMHASDMANDPRQAITLYRQQALDPAIRATIGPTNSVGYVPIVPIAGQLRLVVIGEAGAPVKRWTPWAYRVDPVGATAIPVLLAVVEKKDKFKRLAVIYDQTQDAQAGDAEVCRRMKGKIGYDVVADQAFSSGNEDFSPQIARVRSARPDAIFVASTTGDGIKLVPQIRAAGLDVPLMTGYGAFEDPLYWNGTNGAIKGCYTWLAQDLTAATGDLRAWLDEYNKKFPQKATSYSTYGYDAVMCAVECIKRASSVGRDKIQAIMSDLDYHSPLGTHITFKNPPTGENLSPTVTVVEVTGPGTYVAIK